MIKSALIAIGLLTFVGCSDEQEQTQEQVQASDQDQAQSDDELSMLPEEPMGGMEAPAMPAPSDPMAGDLQAEMNPGMGMGMNAAMPPNSVPTGEGEGEGAAPAGNPMAGNETLFVRCMVLTIRKGPGVEHKPEGYLLFNAEIKPLEQQGKWIKIAENKWISRPFLTDNFNVKPSLPAH